MTPALFAPGSPASRVAALVRMEADIAVRRTLTYIWVGLLLLSIWAEADNGSFLLRSGDSAAGGKLPYVSSEIAFAGYSAFLGLLVYTFFVSILAGLALIRDDEARVGEILNATPLRPGEYVWGKFGGVLLSFLGVVAVHVVLAMLYQHVLPLDGAKPPHGPFVLVNYLRPALLFLVPYVVFLAGVTFALGGITRQPILVFIAPIALVVGLSIMMGAHSDDKASLLKTLLDRFDATGLRWLMRHYLDTDRGVAYYNTTHPDYTPDFLWNRLLFTAAGLGAVWLTQLRHARAVRGAISPIRVRTRAAAPVPATPVTRPSTAPLSVLGMRSRRPGLLAGAVAVARAEVAELFRQPGLYVFVPLIVFITSISSSEGTGQFPYDRLPTSGQLASEQMDTICVFAALLLLAYTVETLERDRANRLSTLLHSLPVRTASLLAGKFAALNLVAALPTLATLVTLLLRVALGGMPVSLAPFGLLWGLLLWPALAAWVAFLMAVYAASGHRRYVTYGVGLFSLLIAMVGEGERGWLANPFLRDGAVRWSDLNVLEADRPAVALSRVVALLGGLALAALAVRCFRRREPDPAGVFGRRRFVPMLLAALPVVPFFAAALVPAVWLYRLQQAGYESESREEAESNYRKRNYATFQDAPVPGITNVEMSIDLHPESRSFTTRGTLTLVNPTREPMRFLPVTGGFDWKNVRWTLDGREGKPEERAGLYVFQPATPLAPGKTVRLGFSYDRPNPGVSWGGGSRMEFFEPSAVVLTSFSTSFLPRPGFDPEIGEDEKNRLDPPDYRLRAERKGPTPPLFGSRTPFTLRLTVSAPDGFTVNSSGRRVAEAVRDGRRTITWESREGIRDFNLVGGRNLRVRRGKAGTTVYYHAAHERNVGEMLNALDAARTNYGRWFAPFPYPELRLTEFPAMEDYAQGFPGNISFSEGIGFLTKTTDAANNAFAVAAHESAHQWWGGIVTPGEGPGGNVISEGMAEFSATLLLTKVKGEDGRRSFLRDLERQYIKARVKDSEEPLARMSGGKAGSVVVTYQRGGWAFWMLMDQVMGRERMLAGLQDFLRRYRNSASHPVLPDLLNVLREHAPNPGRFDNFTAAWFYNTSLPEFRLSNARCSATPDHRWKVTANVENLGTGNVLVPVRIVTTGKPIDFMVMPVPGNKFPLKVVTRDRPGEVILDPDVRVLQLGRDSGNTRARLDTAEP